MKIQLILVAIELNLLLANDDDLPGYMNSYQRMTETYSRDHLRKIINDLTIDLFHFKAFRTSFSTKLHIRSFVFSSVIYHFFFDIRFTKSNMNIRRDNCIATHLFEEILFDQRIDKTFQASFKHENECTFSLYDLLKVRSLDISKSIGFLCKYIVNEIVKSIQNLTYFIPHSHDYAWFHIYLTKLVQATDFGRVHFNFRLNATHTLINMAYDKITHSGQVEQDGKKTRFNIINVAISYSVADESLAIRRETDEVRFTTSSSHLRRQTKTSLSQSNSGEEEIRQIISQHMTQFYLSKAYIVIE